MSVRKVYRTDHFQRLGGVLGILFPAFVLVFVVATGSTLAAVVMPCLVGVGLALAGWWPLLTVYEDYLVLRNTRPRRIHLADVL